MIAIFNVVQTVAQNATGRPTRTSDVIDALQYADWTILANGVEHVRVNSTLGVRLDAFKIDPSKLQLQIVQQDNPTGEDVRSYAKRTNAFLAMNGGFFATRSSGLLYPVGRLVDDGKTVSAAWKKAGGYLVFEEGGISISPTRQPPSKQAKEYIQSKPIILEKGGKWALNNNLGILKNRSLVCLKEDKQIVLVVISGQGLSLFEAGWLLRSQEWGGFFDCDAAIALDGGGSTQLHVSDFPDIAVSGNTNVPNALIVTKK